MDLLLSIFFSLWDIFWSLVNQYSLLILVVFIFLFVYKKTYLFKDKEKVAEDYLRKLAKITKQNKEFAKKFKFGEENAKESEEMLNNLISTHENYLHLTERFRHDKRSGEIKKDWVHYLYGTKAYLDRWNELIMDVPEKQRAQMNRDVYKSLVEMKEIEKRFNEYAKNNK